MKNHLVLQLLLLLLTCFGQPGMLVTARRIQTADFKVLSQVLAAWGSFADGKTWSANSDCSTVQGVTCDADGYVISLATAGNAFYKPIPDAVSGLQHLTYLAITSSHLVGSLPAALFNLPLLSGIKLSVNHLSGSIPDDISKLTGLTYLYLAQNGFSGSVPDALSHLSQLIRLSLATNMLTDSIPTAISTITTLNTLELQVNYFSGPVPDWVSTMPRLMSINMQQNLLNGTIPASLSSMTQLTKLNLGMNFIEGSIPDEIGNLVNLQSLILETNLLNGTIPASLGALKQLNDLQLAWTDIAGTLPSSIGTLTQLNILYLEGMWLTGTVPRSFSNLQNLGYFYLNRNEFSGDIYSITSSMTRLVTLDVSSNQFMGRLPAPPSPSLQFYYAHRCFFSHGAVVPPKANRTFYANVFENCLTAASLVPGDFEGQKNLQECAAFCGLAAGDARPLCNGHGVCSFNSSVQESACTCDSNFDNQAGPHSCTYSVLPSTESSQSTAVSLSAAATQLFNGSIILTPSASSTWGAAVVQTPIRLFHFIDSPGPCGTPFAFNASFTFAMRPAAQGAGGEGLAFVVSLPPRPPLNAQDLALGFVLDEDSFSSLGFNSFFHYASGGFEPSADNSPSWLVKSFSSWILPQAVWPVKNQGGCADSWAYAVVAAVEAAYSIANNRSQPPVLSVDHLRLALSSNCDGGSPTKALQFLLNTTNQGRGLLEQAAYIASSVKGIRSLGRKAAAKPTIKYYGIRGIERTTFYGWFGLMLAVQRQPVIVHIEASAPSFQDYDGSDTYADEGCFTDHLNHVVLVMGYLVAGVDSAKPDLPPPFWIIRNSWGTQWGDQGHMRMDIRSDDGICGINTLPGLFPVVRTPADPCGQRSYKHDILGPTFNPCGQFQCTTKGASNRCKCSDTRFSEVKNTDGSYTCGYVDVCGSSSRNPCVVGTCVNDGRGSYSCVCPRGFIQGTMIGGGFSCTPGQEQGTYTVLGANVFCSHIMAVFSLPLAHFLQQNKGVSCTKPLPINKQLYVVFNIPECSVFYSTNAGDTCAGVGRQVELCGQAASDAACEAAFQALNPAVDCSSLKPSQAVCVERHPSKANRIAVCDEYHRPQAADTCDSIRDAAVPPLSALELYRLNPGINCNQLIPAKSFHFKGSLEREICTKSSTSFAIGSCPTDNQYYFMPTDSCSNVQITHFHGIKGCYRKINGYECVDKMTPGTKVCLPNYNSARTGDCVY
ncbi:hypothetical protein CLOM_g10158 [Closterium sp. NIES-68]|nr:hypothetical protein CLOM_g10158 [Closterium sp. NIES-68]GJP70274.1 hypothetical protein CLOP_g1227 [Closterium sp. NIES-67]